jgi:hypothetical protein
MSKVELSDREREGIENAFRQGHKIEAIKLYREATGTGLKEAKEAVEAMMDGQAPEETTVVSSTGPGCGTAMALLALGLMVLIAAI